MTPLTYLLKFLLEGQAKHSKATITSGVLIFLGLVFLSYAGYHWLLPYYGSMMISSMYGVILVLGGFLLRLIPRFTRPSPMKKLENLTSDLNVQKLLPILENNKKESLITCFFLLFMLGILAARKIKHQENK